MIVGVRVHLLLVLFSVCSMTWTASNLTPLTRIGRSDDGVTTYLEDTWDIWFVDLDINRDSKLSKEDRNLCRDRLIGAYNLSPEEREDMISKMNYWWDHFIFQGNESTELYSDDFTGHLSVHYLESKLKFRENAVVLQSIIHELSDVNDNGKLSLNETTKLLSAFGVQDKSIAEEYFNAYHPKQKEVPTKYMSRAWADFLTINHNNTNNFIRQLLIDIQNSDDY